MKKRKKIAVGAAASGTVGWEVLWDKYYTALKTVLSDPYNAAKLKIGEIAENSRLAPLPHNETSGNPHDVNVSRPLEGAEYFVRDVVAHPIFEGFVKALPFIIMGIYGGYAYKKHRDAKRLERRDEYADKFSRQYGKYFPEGADDAFLYACKVLDKNKRKTHSAKDAEDLLNKAYYSFKKTGKRHTKFNDISKTITKIHSTKPYLSKNIKTVY